MACIVKYVGNNPKIKAIIPETGMPEESFKAWLLDEGMSILDEVYGNKPIEDFTKQEVTGNPLDNVKPDSESAFMLVPVAQEFAINYVLRSVTFLNTEKGKQIFKRFAKTNKDKFISEVSNIAGKQQAFIIKDLIDSKDYDTVEDLILDIITNYSYTVQTEVTRGGNKDLNIRETEYNGEKRWSIVDIYTTMPLKSFKTEKEAETYLITELQKPTSHYSNLTVPGGTNYTENEIKTPDITPSIKGHGAFSTDQGIGWFRSDEASFVKQAMSIQNKEKDFEIAGNKYTQEYSLGKGFQHKKNGEIISEEEYRKAKYSNPKTRRILEVQSDLFQKGRDRIDLINKSSLEGQDRFTSNLGEDLQEAKWDAYYSWVEKTNYEVGSEESFKAFDSLYKIKDIKSPQNKFLQLLNKDNAWVTFFVKSIVQDSAKKGYEKVLFPTGNTASKVEGHGTLEEFKKEKEDRIKDLENKKIERDKIQYSVVSLNEAGLTRQSSQLINGDYILKTKEANGSTGYSYMESGSKETVEKLKKDKETEFDIEITQLKAELERVNGPEGLAALKPIYNFYENTIANVLKKQGYNAKVVTDEYGNTWNEVTVDEARDTGSIQLSTIGSPILRNIDQIQQNLTNLFGSDYVNNYVSVVNKLIQSKAFGAFTKDGKILVSTQSPEGTEYHEAFHRVFRLFTTPQERETLLKGIRNREDYQDRIAELRDLYGDKSTEYLEEELLAEDFRTYANTKQTSPEELSIFERIWNFIKKLFSGNTLNDFYDKILSGYYQGSNIIPQSGNDAYSLSPDAINMTVASNHALIISKLNQTVGLNSLSSELDKLIGQGVFKDLDSYISFVGPRMLQFVAKDTFSKEDLQKVFVKHKEFIGQFVSLPEEEIEETEVKDRLGIKDSDKTSVEDLDDSLVKLIISALPVINQEGKVVLNSVGLPQAVDYVKTLHALHAKLANNFTLESQLTELKKYAEKRPEINKLIEWFKLDKIPQTKDELNLQLKFVQSFAKAKQEFLVMQFNDIKSGEEPFKIIFEKERNINKVKDIWRANLSRSPLVKLTPEGRLLIQLDKLKEALDKSTNQELLDLLGFPDSENYSKYSKKGDLSKIDAALRGLTKDTPVDYFFDKNGLSINKEINSLAEQATLYNDEFTDLNVLDSKNAKRYALSLPTAYAIGDSIIKQGNADYLGNFPTESSLWIKSNRKLVNMIQAKSSLGLPTDYADMDEAAQAMLHYRATMNNIYPVLPSADRGVELAWQLEMPEEPSIDSLVQAVFNEIQYVANLPQSTRDKATPSGHLVTFEGVMVLEKNPLDYSRENLEDYALVKSKVEEFITNEVAAFKDKVAKYDTNHLDKESEDNFRTYMIKHWQSVYEQSNLFTGPLNNFKDPIKRFTLFTSSKKPAINSPSLNQSINALYKRADGKMEDGFESTIVFKDITGTYQEFIKGAIDSNEKGDLADASGIGTLDFIRSMMLRLGQWNEDFQSLYDYENTLTDVYPAKGIYETFALAVKKYGYAGPAYGEDYTPGYYITDLYKMAVMPVLPRSMQYSMPKLVEMAAKMQKAQIGLGVFASGSKGNNINEPQDIDSDEYNVTQRINYSFMGEHLETSPEEHKRVTLGTQMSKLDFVDIVKDPELHYANGDVKVTKEVIDTYNNLLNDITAQKFSKFLDNLSITIEGIGENKVYLFTDKDKLKKEVTEAMLQRKTSETFKEQLQAILSQDVIRADAMAEKVKLENNLMSFYNREVVKRDMPGEMFIQVPDLDNSLKFYEKAESGYGVSYAEVKIALPQKLMPLVLELEGDTFEDKLNKFNKEVLPKFREEWNLVPYRIPTQGQNAIEAVLVKEFLAPTLGNVIVVPNGITIKAGSDFDVDKLTTYVPHYYTVRNQVKVLQSKASLLIDIKVTKSLLKPYKEEFKDYKEFLDEQVEDDEVSLENIKYAEDKFKEMDNNPVIQKLLFQLKEQNNLLRNYDQYIAENEVIDIIAQVVTSEEAKENLLTSDSTDDLKKVALEVIAATGQSLGGIKSYEYTKILSPMMIVATRNKLLKFKQLVGPAALATTSHALFQQADISYYSPEYTLYFDSIQKLSEYPMDSVYDIDNKQKISAILKQFISAAVDVSKIGNDYITYTNVSFNTFGVVNILLRQRIPLDEVIYFLNQPIIREYTSLLDKNNSILNFKGKEKGYKIINSLISKMSKLRSEVDLTQQEIEDGEALDLAEYYDELKEGKTLVNYITKAELKDNMSKDMNTMSLDELKQQVQVLYSFELYNRAGSQLNKIQQVSNQDTKQAGKTLVDSWIKRKMYYDVLEDKSFKNLPNLFEDTLLKELKNTAMEADKIWSSGMQFVSFDKYLRGPEIMDIIYDLYRFSGANNLTTILERADRELATFGLITSPLDSGKTLSEYSSILRTSELMTELLDLKDKFPDNKFLQEMIPLLPEEGKDKGDIKPRSTYNIKLVSQRVNPVQQEILAEGFKELYDNPVTQPFAKKLIIAQLLQSGISDSPISYQKLLPKEYIDMSLQALKNMEPVIPHKFVEQFLQQNGIVEKRLRKYVSRDGYQAGQPLDSDKIYQKGPIILVGNSKKEVYLLTRSHAVIDGVFFPFQGKQYLPTGAIGDKYYYHAYTPIIEGENYVTLPSTNMEGVKKNKYELFPGVFANEGQQQALDLLDGFLRSPATEFTLIGRGGTGKTTIIKKTIEGYTGRIGGITVAHKAKKVLGKSIGKKNAFTVASALAIKLNESTGEFTPDLYARQQGKVPIKQLDLIIVDEASMISPNIYKEIMELKKPSAKVIFMGDNAQLPPVGEDVDSPVFDIKNQYTLVEKMRQAANSPIIGAGTLVARNIESKTPKLIAIPEGFRFNKIDPISQSTLLFTNNVDEALDSMVKDIKEANNNPEYVKAVTFNNENHSSPLSVKNLNVKIREKLWGEKAKNQFNVGEFITAYDTYTTDLGGVPVPVIYNSDDYIIHSLKAINNFTGSISVFSAKMGSRSFNFNYNVVELELLNEEGEILPDLKMVAYGVKILAIAESSKEKFNKDVASLFQTDKQLAFALKANFANLQYGYAITSHKAQGSTYNNVYVFEDNILGSTNGGSTVNKNKSLYVAVSRPSNRLVMISTNNKSTLDSEITAVAAKPVLEVDMQKVTETLDWIKANKPEIATNYVNDEALIDHLKQRAAQQDTTIDSEDFTTFVKDCL
jgi:exodeoxyribonuclease-5